MLNFRRKFFVIALLLITFLSASHDVFACSCAARPTVLDSYEDANVVVATKLVSVNKTREKDKDDEYDIDYISSVKMVVEKVYKGTVKVGEALTFAQGGGADCIWTFDEESIGEKFLFYLDNPTKGHPFFDDEEDVKDALPMYRAVTCGRSRGFEYAKDDLSYLENIEKVRGKTRVSGTLDSWQRNSPSFADIEIKIIGKDKTFKTKTDKEGFFEIYDLPAGEYLVEPKAPFGWKVDESWLRYSASYKYRDVGGRLENKNQVPIILEEKRHAGIEILFEFDNSITGRVLAPNGKPMKKVRVSAVPVNSERLDSFAFYGYTDEKGEFLISTISPGNYNLVVNGHGKIDDDQPFGVLFYPGVADRKNAGVVTIELGKFLKDFVIQIPNTVELIQIKGKLLHSDGKPVAKEDIKFIPTDKNKYEEIRTESDEQGNFSLKIPKLAKGILFGDMYVYSDKFKNCEKLEQIIREKKDNYFDITTNILEIDEVDNLLNVELVFPFPGCTKAKQ